jgi:hypothetical protein
MALVKINGVTYELDALNDEVRTHLKYLSFIDAEIERLKMQLGAYHLSRDQVGRMLDSAMALHNLNQTPFQGNEIDPPLTSADLPL